MSNVLNFDKPNPNTPKGRAQIQFQDYARSFEVVPPISEKNFEVFINEARTALSYPLPDSTETNVPLETNVIAYATLLYRIKYNSYKRSHFEQAYKEIELQCFAAVNKS